MKTIYFLFRQNNPCGVYCITSDLDKNVIIEALDIDHATVIAEKLGITCDEVECECCGAMWESPKTEFSMNEDLSILLKDIHNKNYKLHRL